MKANIVWRLLVPIVLALLLVVGCTSAIFMAGVAITLFVVGLTSIPFSVWIEPVLLLVPGTESERWIRPIRFLLLVSLDCDLASIIVPQLLTALR